MHACVLSKDILCKQCSNLNMTIKVPVIPTIWHKCLKSCCICMKQAAATNIYKTKYYMHGADFCICFHMISFLSYLQQLLLSFICDQWHSLFLDVSCWKLDINAMYTNNCFCSAMVLAPLFIIKCWFCMELLN